MASSVPVTLNDNEALQAPPTSSRTLLEVLDPVLRTELQRDFYGNKKKKKKNQREFSTFGLKFHVCSDFQDL